jgi:hypothetical protein
MQNSVSFILQAVTVALIVVATRWLFGAKGATLPRIRDGTKVYGIKWQWRAVGLAGGAFWVVVLFWSWHDLRHSDGVLIAITATFVIIGLWLGSGSVSTNQAGITKRVLWRSRSFHWGDITEIRLHKKQGEAIELRAGPQKLVVDSRFVAFEHLLNEIEDHTQLLPTGTSS